jgi:hypothetical protein
MSGMSEPYAEARILASRPVLQGTGDPTSLENVIVDPYPNGAVCYVVDQSDFYVLQKSSMATVAAPDTIATIRGAGEPGRWVKLSLLAGSLTNLSNVRFADVGTTVPLAQQTGSILAPFASLQSASDAAGNGGTVLVCPGVYGTLNIPDGGYRRIAQIGVINAGISYSGTSPAGTVGVAVGVITMGAGTRLELNSIHVDRIDPTDDTSSIEMDNCQFTGATSISPGTVTNVGLTARNSKLQGAIDVNYLALENTQITVAAITHTGGAGGAAAAYFRQVQFSGPAAMTFVGAAGQMGLDVASDASWMAATGVLVNGTKVMTGRASATIQVAVPGVVAGQVGYADVDPAATPLAGLADGQEINWNPTDDIEAAGAGGGISSARVYDSGAGAIRIRCTFIGPTTGANHDVKFWTS